MALFYLLDLFGWIDGSPANRVVTYAQVCVRVCGKSTFFRGNVAGLGAGSSKIQTSSAEQ